MVFIIVGNLEIDAHVLSEIGNVICTMHLLRLTAAAKLKLLIKKSLVFVDVCVACTELPSNISTML